MLFDKPETRETSNPHLDALVERCGSREAASLLVRCAGWIAFEVGEAGREAVGALSERALVVPAGSGGRAWQASRDGLLLAMHAHPSARFVCVEADALGLRCPRLSPERADRVARCARVARVVLEEARGPLSHGEIRRALDESGAGWFAGAVVRDAVATLEATGIVVALGRGRGRRWRVATDVRSL